jgi:YfiH family protein
MRARANTKLEVEIDVPTPAMKRNPTRQTGVNPLVPPGEPGQPGMELREPNAGTKRSAQSALDVVQVPEWAGFTFLRHGFSTRTGGTTRGYRPEQRSGELNLGFTASDAKENVEANRALFVAALDRGRREKSERASAIQLVTLKQIHSSLMVRVGKGGVEAGATLKGDGLMTDEPGVLLGIQTADCIPVLVVDRKRRAVAAFHAGWRGTLKRIVETGIGRMRLEFNSRPEDLTAAIGPGVGQCCYAIGEEVLSEFESQFAYAADLFREVYDSDPVREKYPLLFMTARAPGHGPMGPSTHLDLADANRRQLLDAGLTSAAIHMIGECTSCRTDRYFSHRAERGFTGRMLSAVGIV